MRSAGLSDGIPPHAYSKAFFLGNNLATSQVEFKGGILVEMTRLEPSRQRSSQFAIRGSGYNTICGTAADVLLQSKRAFGIRDEMVPLCRSPFISSKPPRRNYTGDEKMAILREALLEKVNVSDVCHKRGITPGMFYEWQKKLFEQGSVVFNRMATAARPTAGDAEKLATAEAKIQQKNEVLAELMSEHVALKKKLGLDGNVDRVG